MPPHTKPDTKSPTVLLPCALRRSNTHWGGMPPHTKPDTKSPTVLLPCALRRSNTHWGGMPPHTKPDTKSPTVLLPCALRRSNTHWGGCPLIQKKKQQAIDKYGIAFLQKLKLSTEQKNSLGLSPPPRKSTKGFGF